MVNIFDLLWYLMTLNLDYHCQLIKSSEVLKTDSTENGDAMHGFTEGVYEIHGNIKYMRWFQEWNLYLYDVPRPSPNLESDSDEIIPKCTQCGSIMRPHILWFDETYTQEMHHIGTIQSILASDIDCLIVVGTELATSLAYKIVKKCLERDILVVEINLR